MFLIVGLGNPGKKYENTWHNLGFRTIDELEPLNLKGVILAKPQNFMNKSGLAVKKAIRNYKLKIKNLIVIHDDLDLPLGKIRIVENRGSAGHKGVESIIKELGSKEFVRIRIGILPKSGKPKNPENFVLCKIKEKKIMDKIIQKAAKAAGTIVEKGTEAAMNEHNN